MKGASHYNSKKQTTTKITIQQNLQYMVVHIKSKTSRKKKKKINTQKTAEDTQFDTRKQTKQYKKLISSSFLRCSVPLISSTSSGILPCELTRVKTIRIELYFVWYLGLDKEEKQMNTKTTTIIQHLFFNFFKMKSSSSYEKQRNIKQIN